MMKRLGVETRNLLYGMLCVGAVSLSLGFYFLHERTWVVFLLNSIYFTWLAASAIFLLAVLNLTGARWSEVLRRVPEAISGYLLYGSIPMFCLVFGLHFLYHWTHGDVVKTDAVLLSKSGYLNIPFFLFRMVLILGSWIVFAFFLRRNSLQEDEKGGGAYHRKNVKLSAAFAVIFAVTFSFASFDWLMSLEPHWYSTIFGIYSFAGMFVNGLAVVALISILLKEVGYLKELNEHHIHDLGKLVFAFCFFWAYVWYSQFVLIWYGNIPEETVYFYNRLKSDWSWLFYANFGLNFIVPFFVLLPRGSKRSGAVLKRVCIVLLVGHWLDLYLMIAPGVLGDKSYIGFLELVVSLGFAAAFILIVYRKLTQANLTPRRSPFMEESLHHHQ